MSRKAYLVLAVIASIAIAVAYVSLRRSSVRSVQPVPVSLPVLPKPDFGAEQSPQGTVTSYSQAYPYNVHPKFWKGHSMEPYLSGGFGMISLLDLPYYLLQPGMVADRDQGDGEILHVLIQHISFNRWETRGSNPVTNTDRDLGAMSSKGYHGVWFANGEIVRVPVPKD